MIVIIIAWYFNCSGIISTPAAWVLTGAAVADEVISSSNSHNK